MIQRGYTQNDVKEEIKTLKKRTSHGTDDIPEEAYKASQTWITEPLTHDQWDKKTENNYQQAGKTEQ